ncbi:MAG: RHS repeat-associated core domain-containing protein [Thermoanaerobaculaceae bacterium]
MIQETNTYAGVGGAVSAKTTAVTVTGSTAANPVQTFSQAFTWTDLGLLASQSYPACTGATCAETPGRTVYNTYAAGFLTAVEPYYATAITYHPSGSAPVTYGKGQVGGWGALSARQWRCSRNITAMGAQPFHYDGVSRLTSGTVTGFGSESYTYDPYGNLTSAGSIVLTTDPATNHLDAAVTGAAYDGAGNLTSFGLSGSTTTYTYDDLNQLASVSGSGINRSQAYTADGERLFVRDGPTYLFTLRDLGGNVIREYEYTTTGGWRWRRDNVYRGGLLLASQGREEGIQHYHLDHLGSPRLVTSRTGEQLRLFATSPFGKDPTATQSSERMRFAVHERDVGSLTDVLDDIDYMHARSYTPRLGRFTGIDLLRGNPFAPRTMNLYAYVVGNPVSLLDPLGMLPAGSTNGGGIVVTGEDPCPWMPKDLPCDMESYIEFIKWSEANQPSLGTPEYASEVLGRAGLIASPVATAAEHGARGVDFLTGWVSATDALVLDQDGRMAGFLVLLALIPGPLDNIGGAAVSRAFNAQQRALLELAERAAKTGVSRQEAAILLRWARQYDVRALGHSRTTHWKGGSHIGIGPYRHIKVR